MFIGTDVRVSDDRKIAVTKCGPDLGRLALFVWFHTPTDVLIRHRHKAFLAFCSVFVPMNVGHDQRYLRSSVTDSTPGAVSLMSKILATIEKDNLVLNHELEQFISIVEALLSFHSEQMHDFFLLPILRSLVDALWRQRREGSRNLKTDMRIWAAIQRILRYVH